MKIVRVGEPKAKRGGILLPDLDATRMLLWSFFEEKGNQNPPAKAEVDKTMRLLESPSFKTMEHSIGTDKTILKIVMIEGKEKRYFLRVKNSGYFDVEKERDLARKTVTLFPIIDFSVKVETELEGNEFVFDFGEILNRLRKAIPNLAMTTGQISTGVMLSYDPYSGMATPFGLYRDKNIQVSFSVGQKMAERRAFKDTWKLDSKNHLIRGPFVSTADEPLPSFQIIIGKVKDKPYGDVLPLMFDEVTAKYIGYDVAKEMKM